MSRRVVVFGESMVYVKAAPGTLIGNLTECGLSDNPIQITFSPIHDDIILDAWGKVPMDVQFKGSFATINIGFIHFDPDVIEECQRLAAGGPSSPGRLGRAGTLLGNGLGRFVPGNNYVGLNIASPVAGRPHRFYFAYLVSPTTLPVGAEKTVIQTQWRAIPYTTDPWQGGAGALNTPFWDHTLDS